MPARLCRAQGLCHLEAAWTGRLAHALVKLLEQPGVGRAPRRKQTQTLGRLAKGRPLVKRQHRGVDLGGAKAFQLGAESRELLAGQGGLQVRAGGLIESSGVLGHRQVVGRADQRVDQGRVRRKQLVCLGPSPECLHQVQRGARLALVYDAKATSPEPRHAAEPRLQTRRACVDAAWSVERIALIAAEER